jgi:hypothetical protein
MDRMNSGLSGRMDKMDGHAERSTADLAARIENVGGRVDRIQSDLTRFYQMLGEHSGKIELLSRSSSNLATSACCS